MPLFYHLQIFNFSGSSNVRKKMCLEQTTSYAGGLIKS